ncbi:DUF2946 domain-containing protein [Dickeya dianthicola]|uniref:DUF2946 domain-containing protein n=1 Tax=Dickeya dianthicola TaxID=204039 RepID=UPI0018E0175E|nr:DUF2946 domain-containing protein [Dickeya dianthicola]MBI0456885.1 DUF2946 domain-containing protein [Dickeya dianthicola]MBI0478229.1 DUF2946 domain-containing protein [Dickeya dianthicola]MBI0484984.1 DUF2946 domain-containing protein [Dickeya dianthicola]MBI0525914.1 DUF2946 domain-containing protein [Dickeya dianthicola]
MSLFELRQRRTPAWLGILALVMIFLAPLVSQSLRANHHVQIALRLHHHSPSTSLSTPKHHHHHHHAMAASAMPKGDMDEIGMDHAACGYCVLLSYLPLLTLSGLLQPIAAIWSPRWQALRPVFSLFSDPRFLSPLPRAPPQG